MQYHVTAFSTRKQDVVEGDTIDMMSFMVAGAFWHRDAFEYEYGFEDEYAYGYGYGYGFGFGFEDEFQND